jgi:hypothetical protein
LQAVAGIASIGHEEPLESGDIPASPHVFTKIHGTRRVQQGQRAHVVYVVLIRLLVLWQGDGTTDDTLAPFINTLPATFDAGERDANGHSYATLGGRVGQAVIAESGHAPEDGHVTYRGVLWRYYDWTLEISESAALGSGL